ncbi:OprD family porin [Serratia rubidaea]|nr:OprD family porin [Serratia rubidaea]
MKINLLTIALATWVIPACAWSSSTDVRIQEKDAIDQVLADPFFTQSQMTLSLKNYWKYLKEDNTEPKKVHNAWGQGVAVDYQSGYFADVIGVDVVYYGAVKLGASDYFNTRGVLYNNGSGNDKGNAEGYSKFGQRNLKFKYVLGDVGLHARWGWQVMKNVGVISTSTRLSPTTYSGWLGAVDYDGLTLRGAYIESSMDRNSPDKKRFQTNTGKYINHIASGDLSWKSKRWDLKYGYGESENYLQRHILQAHVMPAARLKLGAQIYDTHALEEYKAMPAGKRDFDNHARHYTLEAGWRADNWSTQWGLGYTDAKKEHQVGFYPRHMSKNSRGTFGSMAYAGDDYMRDGEVMLANISDYKLTPNFAVGLAGNIGQFNYKGNHVRTGEISAFTRWTPSQMPLKNLTVWTMFGPGWSYKASGKTPVLNDDGRYMRSHTLSSEVIIEYKFKLL